MDNKQAFETVLSEFMKLTQIPRPSHHEEKVSDYLYQWGLDHHLQVRRDRLNEVFIDKPASKGFEHAPTVLFQAHMDMVCVAEEGVPFNPTEDPIKVINDGVKLTADGTSLGADDGIGVALALYILQDDSLQHGPIRALFTTNEEDGMDSMNMEPEYLEGDFLINLDWETLGSLCNSCAGGDFFEYSRKCEWEAPAEGKEALSISFKDLQGGHSGVGINLGRANALVSIATALSMLKQHGIPFQIAALSGGQAKNAIPAAATAQIVISASDKEKATATLDNYYHQFMEAYQNVEPDVKWQVIPENAVPAQVLSVAMSEDLIDLMAVVPNNVHTMSPFVDGLVESSSNLGIAKLDHETIRFTVFARSSVEYQATQLGTICAALASRFGFDFSSEGHVPGWAVNPNSKLVPICCQAYKEITGQDMVVEPVHAGVECGAFAQKNPHLDMIAIGPTLIGVHTPDEVCQLKDVEVTTELLVAVLKKLASV